MSYWFTQRDRRRSGGKGTSSSAKQNKKSNDQTNAKKDKENAFRSLFPFCETGLYDKTNEPSARRRRAGNRIIWLILRPLFFSYKFNFSHAFILPLLRKKRKGISESLRHSRRWQHDRLFQTEEIRQIPHIPGWKKGRQPSDSSPLQGYGGIFGQEK